MVKLKNVLLACVAVAAFPFAAHADERGPRSRSCDELRAAGGTWSALHTALKGAINGANLNANGGLGFNMWGTLVANDGTVCAVAFTGDSYRDQWLASRVISAQKANTANGLSTSLGSRSNSALFKKGLALSTANLYAAVQPGGSLFGLQFSNPVDPENAYQQANGQPDDPATFGQQNDPMVGRPIGGVNVFGGGLALYVGGKKVGGLGVSGDTSCADHFVAWRTRNLLGLDHLKPVQGLSDDDHPDNIIFDIDVTGAPVAGNIGISASGFGHPKCVNVNTNVTSLPAVQ